MTEKLPSKPPEQSEMEKLIKQGLTKHQAANGVKAPKAK